MSAAVDLVEAMLRELAAAALEQLRLVIAAIAELVHDLVALPGAYRSMSYEAQR